MRFSMLYSGEQILHLNHVLFYAGNFLNILDATGLVYCRKSKIVI